ncbi:hypothetical protein GCM10023189_31720 [Nibrella saemangeumensis]|uniref:Uncharacterized protein n=1 Tax=Nibrella saemangeumensis TaxID=1084526 RepID=A0ABP8MZQ1_9BACT
MDLAINTQLAETGPAESKPIMPLYGGATKTIREMNEEDFARIAEAVMAKVKEQAFSRGLPIVYERNGHVIEEYADGRIEIVV